MRGRRMRTRQKIRTAQRELNWTLRDHVPGYARINDWHRAWSHRLIEATVGRDAFGVRRWNTDKPHRCPACHAIAVDDRRPSWRETYDCCRCGIRFARWPFLWPLLLDRGVVCTVHRGPNTDRAAAEQWWPQ